MQTTQYIVEYIAKHKLIENLINKLKENEDYQDLEDLSQDLYIRLLNKPNDLLNKMYDNPKLMDYYLYKMVKTELRSNTSKFAQQQNKKRKQIPIDENLI